MIHVPFTQPEFGDWLLQQRASRGYSQTTFAMRVGMSPQYICHVEHGRVLIGRRMMLRLMSALDLEVVGFTAMVRPTGESS